MEKTKSTYAQTWAKLNCVFFGTIKSLAPRCCRPRRMANHAPGERGQLRDVLSAALSESEALARNESVTALVPLIFKCKQGR